MCFIGSSVATLSIPGWQLAFTWYGGGRCSVRNELSRGVAHLFLVCFLLGFAGLSFSISFRIRASTSGAAATLLPSSGAYPVHFSGMLVFSLPGGHKQVFVFESGDIYG